MPKKIIFTALEYRGFTALLKEHGYVELGSIEESRYLQKQGIDIENPPRHQQIKEQILVLYTMSGFRVIIRTTAKAQPFKVASSDAGWIIIENEKGNAVVFRQPFHRTLNFLQNMLDYAQIFKILLLNMPLCTCGSEIEFFKTGLRNYSIRCKMHEIALDHIDPVDMYDFVLMYLPKRLRHVVNVKRSKDAYNKSLANKKGKVFGQRVIERNRWKKKTI